MRRGLLQTGLRAEFLHDTTGGAFQRDLMLLWHDTKPHQVVVDFGSPQYVIDRDLFYAGLDQPAGIGNVRVFPWRGDDGWTVVSITGPDRSAAFLIPTGACLKFLTRTYTYTPADVDLTAEVDAFIAACLKAGAS
jgi:hypothetical protein